MFKSIALSLFALLSLSSSLAFAGYCLPRNAPPEAKDWPICGIYMHGLFTSSGPYSEKTWEVPFRNQFNKIALAKKCKIAVPIGNKGRYWNWNSTSLPEMRRRAAAACSGAKFVAKPSLIGFSNAANVLRRNAANSCSTVAGYGLVTAIGANKDGSQRNSKAMACGNFKFIGPHAVPALTTLAATIRYQDPALARRSSAGPTPKARSSQRVSQ